MGSAGGNCATDGVMGCGLGEGGEVAGGAYEVAGGVFPLGDGELVQPVKHTQRIKNASRNHEERLVISAQGTIEHHEAKNIPLSRFEQI